MKRFTLILLIGLLCLPGQAAEISTAEIAAHIRFLSHDLLEGRGIGTRGGALAVAYIETVFRAAGLEPVFADSFLQEFTLRRVQPDGAARMTFTADGQPEPGREYAFGDDFVAVSPLAANLKIDAELVYMGYGIVSDRWHWNDYKDVDLSGKIALIHVNEPGRDKPELFEGEALTYFGRWMYKYQEAARQGAAGVILIHDTEDAGYDWTVVRNSWSGANFLDPEAPDVSPLQAWIAGTVSADLFDLAGQDFAQLRAAAQEASFQPVPLGVKVQLELANSMSAVATQNVAAIARGTAEGNRAIVITAHHDHLGRRTDLEGDQIFNGAVDNGSALATLLALANHIAAQPEPFGHDVIFLAVAAEEEGMLGSAYFVRNPPLPVAEMAANLNLELTNVWGRTSDLIAIGARHSDLAAIIGKVAEEHRMTVSPESAPEQGYFYRSDQLSFARAGVPAVWIDCGEQLADGEPGLGTRLRQQYRATAYHRPADEFDPTWELTGTQQLTELILATIEAIDTRPGPVNWLPESGFQR